MGSWEVESRRVRIGSAKRFGSVQDGLNQVDQLPGIKVCPKNTPVPCRAPRSDPRMLKKMDGDWDGRQLCQ